ncbi:GNAT family N-acetyltransferase [Streptomyces sp. NPDC005955]|uniref:GNAT family N-acetyltransferase n=1 Tax=Streptomyces sp. NPDC005955 TaxID=3364738 RepID=UPI0036CD0ACD
MRGRNRRPAPARRRTPDGTREAARPLVRAHEDGAHRPGRGVRAGVRTTDGSAIGEIGHALVPAARGHGYATEALGALTAWGLRDPAVRSVHARAPDERPGLLRVRRRPRRTCTRCERDENVLEFGNAPYPAPVVASHA